MLYKSRVGGGWRDFSCPGQKASGPEPPVSHTSSPVPAFLTQLPTVMDDDMCHITSTCIHRGSASSMLACFWLNRRSELRGDMWHLRHSNLPLTYAGVRGDDLKLPGWKGDTSNEGPGSMLDQAGSHTAESSLKITNGS